MKGKQAKTGQKTVRRDHKQNNSGKNRITMDGTLQFESLSLPLRHQELTTLSMWIWKGDSGVLSPRIP